MGKVSIIATIKVKDGRGDDMIAAFEKGAALLHTEPGTESTRCTATRRPQHLLRDRAVHRPGCARRPPGRARLKALGGSLGDAIESFDLQFCQPRSSAPDLCLGGRWARGCRSTKQSSSTQPGRPRRGQGAPARAAG